MSNLQVPKTPAGVPASLRQWFDAVGKTIQGFLSKGRAGFLTRGELEGVGVIGIGGDGTATTPTGDLTTPPMVSGLTANGALASIFLNWDAPTSANLAYVEILRADTNDYGTAYPIGTAVRGVNMYKDNVGSGATKYYWVRAVTKAGVKGPPNAVSGVKGTTGYDPSYVMKILTSGLWYPSTLYEPYQYVRPSTSSNYQYVCVSGGISGTVWPTWPTTVGHTVTDGTCTWACEALTTRVPFAIGSVDGQPAVSILSAFIQDACITNAKVHDMSVEKLTAGIIDAISMQLGGYLWNGFDDFDNPTNVAGFWFGMSGSTPRLKLSTGFAGGNKGLTFDGTNLTVTGDGKFDDVFGDNARFELMSANYASFTDRVIPSDYIDEHTIDIDNPDYNKYLCAMDEVFKSATPGSKDVGTLLLINAPGGLEIFVYCPDATKYDSGVDTGATSGVMRYSDGSTATVVRFKTSSCAFVACASGHALGVAMTFPGNYSEISITILIDNGPTGTTIDLKANAASIMAATESAPFTFTATGRQGGPLTLKGFVASGKVVIVCEDDGEQTGFYLTGSMSAHLKVTPSVCSNTTSGPGFLGMYGPPSYLTIELQLWKPQYTPVSTVTSDARLY